MKIKPKHQEFIINYLRTKDPAVAYKMTYPKAGFKSLSAAASRLMARPEVAAMIADAEDSVRTRTLNELEAQQSTELQEELLTINQKRDILAKIITGKTKRTRHFKARYGLSTVQEEQPADCIIRAIDLDTRLEMFHNFLIGQHTTKDSRTQQVYINAPTLQQQVNILISQALQEEEKENNSHAELDLTTQETPLLKSGEPVPLKREDIGAHAESMKANRGGSTFVNKTLTPPFQLTKLNKNDAA